MTSPAHGTRPIALVAVGDVEPDLVATIAADVRTALGRGVVLAEPLPVPAYAFSQRRRQWSSAAILDALAAVKRPEWVRLLGVVDVDLYAPGLDFVFGEADREEGVAVFSAARLRAGPEGARRLRRRASTEAVHELGHTFGLGHCTRRGCVMWFSNTLAETDRKGPRPCEEHARALARAVGAER